jgi:hypothetical protein
MSVADLGYCRGSRAEKAALLRAKLQASAPDLQATLATTPMRRTHSADIKERMRMLESAMTKTNFVQDVLVLPEKGHPDYGRPQEGTRTAERGKRAQTHVHKEILELCELIYTNGMEEEDHTAVMLFGDLFRLYTRISDKVVGILLRAKKYGLVYFEPEMLFQGEHDDVPIFLAKPMQEIYFHYNTHNGFVIE